MPFVTRHTQSRRKTTFFFILGLAVIIGFCPLQDLTLTSQSITPFNTVFLQCNPDLCWSRHAGWPALCPAQVGRALEPQWGKRVFVPLPWGMCQPLPWGCSDLRPLCFKTAGITAGSWTALPAGTPPLPHSTPPCLLPTRQACALAKLLRAL